MKANVKNIVLVHGGFVDGSGGGEIISSRTGGNIESSPLSLPTKSVSHDDDIFCSDPNCLYCKDLRVAQEQWMKAQVEGRHRADAA
jgi:hypothetical protein